MTECGRRPFLRSCVGCSLGLFAGCSQSGPTEKGTTTGEQSTTDSYPAKTTTLTTDRTTTETTAETTTENQRTTETSTTQATSTTTTDKSGAFTVFPDEAGRIITRELSPTASCNHAVALVTSEAEAEQFDWDDADEGVPKFVANTNFEKACLVALKTKSSGQIEYEVNEVERTSETTLRVHATAKSVPGPSTSDTDTRLVRVHLDDSPTPSRVIVVRTTKYSDERLTVATDDTTCTTV